MISSKKRLLERNVSCKRFPEQTSKNRSIYTYETGKSDDRIIFD